MYRSLVALILPVLVLLSLAAPARPAEAYQQCANVLMNAPRSGATVRGDVEIFGSASIDRFQFYKVEFSPLSNPDAWAATSQVIRRPILNGRLDVWNSRAVPDGLYNLKLTVVDDRAQEVCRAVVTQVQVANRAPVATDTPAMAPSRLDAAASEMACRGVSTLVETLVAMALAVSWKPLMNSKASATRKASRISVMGASPS